MIEAFGAHLRKARRKAAGVFGRRALNNRTRKPLTKSRPFLTSQIQRPNPLPNLYKFGKVFLASGKERLLSIKRRLVVYHGRSDRNGVSAVTLVCRHVHQGG
jgi:hypothetical protein